MQLIGKCIYPLVMTNIDIENGHRNSGIPHKKMVIFHSYVKLPEGTDYRVMGDPGASVASYKVIIDDHATHQLPGCLHFLHSETFVVKAGQG